MLALVLAGSALRCSSPAGLGKGGSGGASGPMSHGPSLRLTSQELTQVQPLSSPTQGGGWGARAPPEMGTGGLGERQPHGGLRGKA